MPYTMCHTARCLVDGHNFVVFKHHEVLQISCEPQTKTKGKERKRNKPQSNPPKSPTTSTQGTTPAYQHTNTPARQQELLRQRVGSATHWRRAAWHARCTCTLVVPNKWQPIEVVQKNIHGEYSADVKQEMLGAQQPKHGIAVQRVQRAAAGYPFEHEHVWPVELFLYSRWVA